MNLLSLLPPETAHKLAIAAVRHRLAPLLASPQKPLPLNLLGKTFINPVGLAAGADKKAEALAGWARMGFGFVEAGTVTRHPRDGNPQPRLWRRGDNSLINWLGLPGSGMEPFVENLKRFEKRNGLIVGASLASPDGRLDELKELAAAIAPYVDYLTLNMSCPNVTGHSAPDTAQVKAVIGDAGGKPVLVKIAPSLHEESLTATVHAVMDAGAAGIVATNTVSFDNRSLLVAAPSWPHRAAVPVGGYSGPQLLDISCWMVRHIRAILGPAVPLMGCGGVQSGADAMKLLDAGADAIQLYTGLVYKGPVLLGEIRRACAARRQQDQPLP